MTTTRRVATAALVAGCALALHIALAQVPGLSRTDLQRHDLGATGREVIQVRVDFVPGVTAPNHSVKNVGSGNAAELATYIVEKGKPLVVLAK